MNIGFPFRLDRRGRVATASDAKHVIDLIEQLLFTSPGERVNLPDFGSGVMQLVFAPNSPELAAAMQFTMQAALQKYLNDLIRVQSLQVTCVDSVLSIDLQYILLQTGQSIAVQITRPN